MVVEVPRGKGQLVLVVQPIEKHWKSLLWCMYEKGMFQSSVVPCNKRDHSVFNNGMTYNVAFRQNSVTLLLANVNYVTFAVCYCNSVRLSALSSVCL